MKKILFLMSAAAAVSLACSCEKLERTKPATYTVTMALSTVNTSYTIYHDLTAYEYNEAGEIVANNSINKAANGSSQTFTANSRAVKVKLYMKMYSDVSTVPAQYYWVQQVFYLEPGSNIEIRVEDHTKVGKSEP